MFNPNNTQNVKNQTLEVIADNPGKTAKEIHARIRQKNTTSYQATHKSLSQLVAEKIIEKNGQTYTLSVKWVHDSKKFLEKAESNLTNPDRIELDKLPHNTTITLNFNESWIAPFYWLLHQMAEQSKKKKPKGNTIIVMYGAWPVMVAGKKEYDELQTLTKAAPTKLVCTTNHALDGLVLEFWKKRFGTPYVKDAQTTNHLDEVVFDDFIIQVHNPQEINDFLIKSFAKQILDLPGIYRMCFEKKVSVKVVITRNRHLAEQYRKNLLQVFKKATN